MENDNITPMEDFPKQPCGNNSKRPESHSRDARGVSTILSKTFRSSCSCSKLKMFVCQSPPLSRTLPFGSKSTAVKIKR
jgi:hypothetical protein